MFPSFLRGGGDAEAPICLLIRPSEANTGPGEATGLRETPLERRQIPPSATRWINQTHLLCVTFVGVELGMLGDFTFRSEISNTPQQPGCCHEWCDHGGMANICCFAVACAPIDVHNKNHFFFYNTPSA